MLFSSCSSVTVPAAAGSIVVSTEASTAVEAAGSVRPIRNAVGCCWPPVAAAAKAPNTSVEVNGCAGQPSASATGRRTARTTGDEAMLDGRWASIRAASGRMVATSSHRLESGTHTAGNGPSRVVSQPAPSAAASWLGCLGITVTTPQRPPEACTAFHRSAAAFSTLRWPGDTASTVGRGLPAQAVAAGLLDFRYRWMTPGSTVTAVATATTVTTAPTTAFHDRIQRRPRPACPDGVSVGSSNGTDTETSGTFDVS